MVLQVVEYPCDLKGQLPCRSQNDGLKLACSQQPVGSELLHEWQTEGEGFTRAGQIPDNQIFPIKNISKSHVLNGEEADDAAFYETICSLFLNLWKIREIARVLTILGITYHALGLRFDRRALARGAMRASSNQGAINLALCPAFIYTNNSMVPHFKIVLALF